MIIQAETTILISSYRPTPSHNTRRYAQSCEGDLYHNTSLTIQPGPANLDRQHQLRRVSPTASPSHQATNPPKGLDQQHFGDGLESYAQEPVVLIVQSIYIKNRAFNRAGEAASTCADAGCVSHCPPWSTMTTAAFVRVSGPPNSNFLVGYPGISATSVSLPRAIPRMSLDLIVPSQE